MKKRFVNIFVFITVLAGYGLQAQDVPSSKIEVVFTFTPEVFPLVHSKKTATIFTDAGDAEVVQIAANGLAQDVERISGLKPQINKNGFIQNISGYPVIIGTIGQSALIDMLVAKGKLEVSEIQGKWESFMVAVIDAPFENVDKALVIAGSDRRGTAFGVYEISDRLGVSPWYWWADVKPEQQENLYFTAGALVQGPPSVKYRGIFLNDEDWGLQPWAAQNMDKDIKDIGPNTYARIFELLLRLKANLIWPAMHPSTKAFFHYPGNPEKAEDYAIVVGTSHAEPMLRNNVDEWNGKEMGSFDYTSNRQTVHDYWENRVKESKDLEAIYTMGMRGVHDSGMKGVGSASEAARLLEKIIADQRAMLQKHVKDSVIAVPQAFTAYKEVLDIYDQGMQLPEDITLVWPDDNYGYIRRLSNQEEQARTGGSGVYYHASYWGRPHDYLWLSSAHPSLIRAEMMKAHELEANQIWVLNLGDIKPLEYNMDLFLDMAYHTTPFQESSYTKEHLEQWVQEIFGEEMGALVSQILWKYYDLAFERRPEFMGWSRTEPKTETDFTEYNHFYYGDEAQKRMDQYEALEQEVKKLRTQISHEDADAFYQLVYYPVVGASQMNKKFLYRDKSYLYAKQNRTSASDYAQLSRQAYNKIVEETNYYNHELSNGKWKGMMSMEPRHLPVYQEPEIPEVEIESKGTWAVAPEGFVSADSSFIATDELVLPVFTQWGSKQYFIDLYLTSSKPVSWKASSSAPWIKVSEQKGNLTNTFGQKDHRLWVSIDWNKVPEGEELSDFIKLNGAGKTYKVEVKAEKPADPALDAFDGFVENNGYVSIFAENYSRKKGAGEKSWALVEDLGHTSNSLMSLPLEMEPIGEEVTEVKDAPVVEYDFYTFTIAAPEVIVSTLPTHPVNSNYSLRYGVSVDDGPVEIVDFRTFGRSDEWKENVLENRADRKVKFPQLNKGKHTLKVYLIDPGVILDRIAIDLGGLKKAYSTISETKFD